jgi:hypothetical protein
LDETNNQASAEIIVVTAEICALPGDEVPCDNVSLNEVVNYITEWASNRAALDDVVNLIYAWAAS